MKLFENEKLKNVNDRIKELNEKRESLQAEVDEILQAVSDSVEAYAMGNVDEKDVQKAEQLLHDKTEEIKHTEEMIQRVKGVRKKVAVESLPFVKEARSKKVAAIQKEYDAKEDEVREARNEFLRKLGELGEIRSKVGNVNAEYNSAMVELGENPATYGAALNETVIISGGWSSESKALGVKENIQKQAAAGNVPDFAKKGAE